MRGARNIEMIEGLMIMNNSRTSIKGRYRSDYYVPIEYNNFLGSNFETINHEFGHAELTENTFHGVVCFEIMQLINENYFDRRITDIFKILRDAAERTEECYAAFFNIFSLSEKKDELLSQYCTLKETEYYHRYQMFQFEKIIYADVSIQEKRDFLFNILHVAMDTKIMEVPCNWYDPKAVLEEFRKYNIFLNPDKRLKKILHWINSYDQANIPFNSTKEDIHTHALDEAPPLWSEYDVFVDKMLKIVDENHLNKTYREKGIQFTGESNFAQRILFYFNNSDYLIYQVDLPNLVLCDCDTLEYYSFGYEERAVFTSYKIKERYILNIPSRTLMKQIIDNFTGIIIAYLDDFEALNTLIECSGEKKVIYKSICNFSHLRRELLDRNINIASTGIIKYDSSICVPFFVDVSGRCYSGGAGFIEPIYSQVQEIDNIIEAEEELMQTAVKAKEFVMLTSLDVVADKCIDRIALFNGTLSKKIFSKDAGIDNREIAGYYFDIYRDSIKQKLWKDAQSIFNYVMNILQCREDKIMALAEMDNILTECKNILIAEIQGDEKVPKEFLDLYSIVIQYTEMLCGSKCESMCITMNNVANLCLQCGNLADAYTYACIALEMKKSVFGENSPKTARGYYLIGRILIYSDKTDECWSFLNTALKLAIECDDYQLISAIHKLREYKEKSVNTDIL